MPRTPYCHPRGPEPASCPICERYVREPKYAAFIDRVRREKPPPERVALPVCSFAGEAAGPKGFHLCDHPDEPLGKSIVCGCQGCGPRCPGYAAVGGRPGWVTVPQPPPLDLHPARDRALATVVVGDEAKACFAASGPHMRAYAESVGADLVVLDWPGHPDWPMSAKFAIGRVLDHYDRIIYADADVLFRPGCVNLFEMCAPHEMGVADELPWHRSQPQHGRERQYLEFRRETGFAPVKHLPWMFNAGVMVVPRSHRDLLLPPEKPIKVHHCSEQDHTNARLLDSGMPYRLLDRRCNWQNWTDHGFKSAPAEAVLHWSGAGGDRVSRADQIREWADRHPWPESCPLGLPESANPAWEVDERHVWWLHRTLMSGRFRSALEVGCLTGFSTRAFLDALRAGALDRLDLCDVAVTPELEQLVAASGVADRVTINRTHSADLLARGSWDLVFVDGDHSEPTVAEETRLLLASGVRALFAHDTAAAGRYPQCEGPALLAREFRRAGYLCAEDALARPGERTDRGMFYAAREPGDFAAGAAALRG